MQVTAQSKAVRISPRKVGIVASLVRHRTVEDALTILEHTPRRAALPISKTIQSARANAENNHNVKPSTLRIAAIEIGPAPSLKRFRPAAHGRANPYMKRATHITVVVEGEERTKKKAAAKKKDGSEQKETKKPEAKASDKGEK